MIVGAVVLGLVCFGIGIAVGVWVYYRYVNHMFCKHPEFFRAVMERKIRKQRKKKAMASWDTYQTVEAFCEAVQSGEVDTSTLTAYIDCGDFFVLNEHEEELISGVGQEAITALLKVLGITNVLQETVEGD